MLIALAKAIARGMLDHQPPKIEGGSDARRQWLSDILAIQKAFYDVTKVDMFGQAMDARTPGITRHANTLE